MAVRNCSTKPWSKPPSSESGIGSPPLSCVSWFRVRRWTYQNRNRLATTPAIRIRLLLPCAFCGDRVVLGLITAGRWCWGTAALAPCFLIRWAGVLAMAPLSPFHGASPAGLGLEPDRGHAPVQPRAAPDRLNG